MIQLGQINNLVILRITRIGLYLGDDENNEILLPNNVLPPVYVVGEKIEVFVYRDSEDRLIATTRQPKLFLNEFAYLKVKDVSNAGAFLDWGLEKDLLVPYAQQKTEMVAGKSYVVCLYLDMLTNRLAASSRISRFLRNEEAAYAPGEEVSLLIYEKTELGYNAIINGRHQGLLYHNEIYTPITIGDRLAGYIKKIRPDKGIDLTINKPGLENLETNSLKILEYLKRNKGFMKFTDKSDVKEIEQTLQMSKKTFKRALGILYKQRLVRLEPEGTYLI